MTQGLIRQVIGHVEAGAPRPKTPVRFVVRWSIFSHYARAEVFEASYSCDELSRPMVYTLEEIAPEDECDVCDVTIKWDGCADWHFGHVSLHTCNKDDVQAVAELMVHLRKQAEDLIPEFDHDTAD